jgi:hypothetical protein
MAIAGRGRSGRRHRRLPVPLFRAHRPRHRRPRKSIGRRRAPGSGAGVGPRRRRGSPPMSEPSRSASRTAGALAARHRDTQAALRRVRDTIVRLRRENTPVSVVAVARRAGVSRTFLYTNADAKTAVAEAIREAVDQRSRLLVEADNSREATWRERALNAEDALKAAHAEIRAQRTRIGELLGQIRDLEMGPRRSPTDQHRERHPQTTRASAQRRQPHARRACQSRPVQPSLSRPSHRLRRSPTHRPEDSPVIAARAEPPIRRQRW